MGIKFTFLITLLGLCCSSLVNSASLKSQEVDGPIDPRIPVVCFGMKNGSDLANYVEAPEISADPEEFVHFFLYTSQNPTEGQELIIDSIESVENSNFIKGAPTKFVAHGFMSGLKTNYPWDVRQAYLDWGDALNVILVDWKQLANNPTYVVSAERTKIVGQKSARLFEFLIRENYVSHENLHIQGMSLGAHVAGVTGGHLFELTGKKAARVSGCDPALPWFTNTPDSDQLDASDGEFVDVVHTAGLTLGFFAPLGHVDFYPNNGKPVQPGCGFTDLAGCCSHFRGAMFCIEAINRDGPKFNACKCESWTEFNSGNCACTEKAVMGEHCSTSSAHGSYYLRTNKQAPFAMG
jgi:hypothetical protein